VHAAVGNEKRMGNLHVVVKSHQIKTGLMSKSKATQINSTRNKSYTVTRFAIQQVCLHLLFETAS
jgi:hypothetical protein